jgi:hypothetical protein
MRFQRLPIVAFERSHRQQGQLVCELFVRTHV